MGRIRFVVVAIVCFFAAILAPGTWINRAFSAALCAVFSFSSTFCPVSLAKSSERVVAADVPAVSGDLLAQRSGEFDDQPSAPPAGNSPVPPYPQEVGPNVPVRPEFENPDTPNPVKPNITPNLEQNTTPDLTGNWIYQIFATPTFENHLFSWVVQIKYDSNKKYRLKVCENCQHTGALVSESLSKHSFSNPVRGAVDNAIISWQTSEDSNWIIGSLQAKNNAQGQQWFAMQRYSPQTSQLKTKEDPLQKIGISLGAGINEFFAVRIFTMPHYFYITQRVNPVPKIPDIPPDKDPRDKPERPDPPSDGDDDDDDNKPQPTDTFERSPETPRNPMNGFQLVKDKIENNSYETALWVLGALGIAVAVYLCWGSGTCELVASFFLASQVMAAANPPQPNPPQPPRPSPGPQGGGGSSTGDPHLTTFDGQKYDHQAMGEFVLTRTKNRQFEIQVREAPFKTFNNVAINTAAAMKVGNARVALYTAAFPDDKTNILLRIDGKPVDLQGTQNLPGGGSITRTGDLDWMVQWPTGEQATFHIRGAEDSAILEISAALPDSDRSQLEGLLGNFNGNSSDDFMTRDGRVVQENKEALNLAQSVLNNFNVSQWVPIQLDKATELFLESIHKEFGDSWRISQSESLFDYAPGKNTDSFSNRAFPNGFVVLRMLAPQAVQLAEEACRKAEVPSDRLEGCLFDVAVTGDVSFADIAANIIKNKIRERVEQEIQRRVPLPIPKLPF